MAQHDVPRDSLIEFLRSGTLCNMRLGMSTAELRQQFGGPDDIAINGQIWLYGSQGSVNIQIQLADNAVHGIGIYFWGNTDLNAIPTGLVSGDWRIDGRTTIEEFIALMDAEALDWTILETLTFDEQTCIRLQSGVHCLWSHDLELHLQKILITASSTSA
ncbi:MAG TPA: hypothetical protein VGM98_22745 [Schlesneria sp.]